MDTANAFATDVRMLTCPSCGAPLHVSPAGGHFNCDHCRSPIDVEPRYEAGISGPRPTDDERIKGLWTQAETYVKQSLPPEMMTLLAAGPLTEDRISPALNLWQSYCQRAKAGDAAAAGYAVLMTGSITSYFVTHGDRERQRALLETAMDTLPSLTHKAVMRCRLARAALSVGETDAARSWLASCDPASPDLEADTDYRLTAANLATVDGDFAQVLTLLGPTKQSIPVALPQALLLDTVRANAVEKTGDVHAAAALLVETAQAIAGGSGAQLLPQVIAANPRLALCPQSLPLATAQLASAPAPAPGGDNAAARMAEVLKQGGTPQAALASVMGQSEPAETKRRGLFGRHKS